MYIENLFLFFRKIYSKLFGLKKRPFFNGNPPEYKGQDASDLIYKALISNNPIMISRFGVVEFGCVYQYKVNIGNRLKKYWKFIIGDIDSLSYSKEKMYKLQNNAGFFPVNKKEIDSFSKLMIKDAREINILGSIIDYENEFKAELNETIRIGFEDLAPYNNENPWSRALKGKKVLVIHPYEKSIRSQYSKRDKLFSNQKILPIFELITYKPVQSLADNYKNLEFKNWFEALAAMKRDISDIDFDIAILGCGAYGLPLAAHIKRMGKKSVHLGGATQIIFGIIGKRWEEEYDLEHLINDDWIRPSKQEIPANYMNVENGCYW